MQEDLLMFWGWTENDHSYEGLVQSAPKNWHLHTVNFEYLMRRGWINGLNESVENFLKEKKLKKVHLMGHSMGGALALEFAFRNPAVVKSLFLLDSAGVYGHETLPQLFTNFFRSHSRKGESGPNIKAIYRAAKRPVSHLKLAKYAHLSIYKRKQSKLRYQRR